MSTSALKATNTCALSCEDARPETRQSEQRSKEIRQCPQRYQRPVMGVYEKKDVPKSAGRSVGAGVRILLKVEILMLTRQTSQTVEGW